MANGVRFIRVHGRVVPLRNKGGAVSDNKKKAGLLRQLGNADKKLADAGRRISLDTGLAAIVTGTAAVLTKSKGFGVATAGLGALSFLHASFASGRSMSSKDYASYAKKAESGQKITSQDRRGIGGASERALRYAKGIQKMGKKGTTSA